MQEKQSEMPGQRNPAEPRPSERGRRLLDQVYGEIERDPLSVAHSLSKLFQGLHDARQDMPRDEWQRFCRNVVPGHVLTEYIHQDPFTRHSARKPRGYAGDAELLDYIYGLRKPEANLPGRNIYDYNTGTTVCQAVRNRAKTIASIIDRLAAQRGSIRVLSIACGHLREADMCEAVQHGNVDYVAFDQDDQSLAHVNERLGKKVRTVQGSVAELLMGRHKDLSGFDFVYAAGLYDYLSQKLATRMTTWMFNATHPGGLTLLTNFVRDVPGVGYMEAFMDWELIYRTPEELANTAGRIPPDQIAQQRAYHEATGAVAFVELHKTCRVRLAADAAFKPATRLGNSRPARPAETTLGT